jgi:hypothetical protein
MGEAQPLLFRKVRISDVVKAFEKNIFRPGILDFLWRSVALANSMRLSLMKAAHAVYPGCA